MDIDSSALITLLPDDETHGNHLRAPAIGIVDLHVKMSGKTSKCHLPRQSPITPPTLATDGSDDFNFLPEYDTGELIFEIHNPFDIVDQAKLEIYKRDEDQPLATIDLIKLDRNWARHGVHKVTWDGRIVSDAAPAPGTINAEETTHDLTTVAAKTDASPAAPFPDGYLTLEHGPYKIRLVLESDLLPDMPAVAWTYVHVLLAKLELKIGPEEAIPNDGAPPTLAMDKVVRKQIEDDGFPADGGTLKVYLLHNNFKNTDAELEDTSNADYTTSATLWGDGPRIPILAKIWLKAADGSQIDLETSAKGALALGRARFMWDVEDPDEVPQPEPGGRAANGKARKFIAKAIQYYKKSKDGRRAADNEKYYQGDNGHVDRGGRRGPNATIHFPDQAGYVAQAALNAAQFPFQVGTSLDTPTKRLWAAFSIGWTSGKLKGFTGVLFRPSRIAGDNYIVTVRLPWDHDDKGVWITDVKDKEIKAPDALVVKSGIFEIWRRTQVVRYIRKSGGVDDFMPSYDQMSDYYKPAYIDMKKDIAGGDNYLMAAHCSPAGGAAFDYNTVCQNLLSGAGIDIYDDGSLKRTPEDHASVAAAIQVPPYAEFVQSLHVKHFVCPNNDFTLQAAADGVTADQLATGLATSAPLDETAGALADQQRAQRLNATRTYLRNEGLWSLKSYSQTLEKKMTNPAFNLPGQSACISGGGPSAAAAPPGVTVMHYQYLTSATQDYVDAGNADHDGLRGAAVDVSDHARDKVVFALWRPLIPTFAHEIGHHLFLPHTQPPAATASALEVHDRSDKGSDPGNDNAKGPMCLMSYHSQRHGFCGFCQLRLRGWDWNAAGGPLKPKASDNKKS
jgi:hypothetical protein